MITILDPNDWLKSLLVVTTYILASSWWQTNKKKSSLALLLISAYSFGKPRLKLLREGIHNPTIHNGSLVKIPSKQRNTDIGCWHMAKIESSLNLKNNKGYV